MVQRNARFEESDHPTTYENIRERASDIGHRSQEMVQEHPATMALVAFGVGFGVGMLLVSSMMHPTARRKSWYEDYLPSVPQMPNLPDRKTMARYLPDAFMKHVS